MSDYVELQVTSNFSFLRGASHPDELVLTAAALGYDTIALADRNSFAGIVRAHLAARQAGLHLVIATRLVPRDGPEVLCFPTDRAAYGRLCRLLTLGKRRAAKGDCDIGLDDIADHAEGQIAIVLPPTTLPPAMTTAVSSTIFPGCAKSLAATAIWRHSISIAATMTPVSPGWPAGPPL